MTEDLVHNSYNFLWQQLPENVIFILEGLSRPKMATVHLRIHDLNSVRTNGINP